MLLCIDVVFSQKFVFIVLIFRIVEFRIPPELEIAVHHVHDCGVTGLQDFFSLPPLTSFSPLSHRRLKVLLKNKCAVSHYVRSRALFRHVLRTFSVTFTVDIMNNHANDRLYYLHCILVQLRNRSNCFHDITWAV